MTPERWQEVKKLLDQALALKPEDRHAFLDGSCSSDHELRAEIAALLSEEEFVHPEFLQFPSHLESPLSSGQIFAERFRLIRRIGEGGMGQVWLAEQTVPVRRPVAVKLIRAGMYDESVVKRFQAERQSLALMDHPAIAKVFEAGATPQGQPYFVMEYVPGLPITKYCDSKKLKIEDRLSLFIQACEGVQHAHQKAIIHRDLKPANILVVELDGKPAPRIIDFGLARAAMAQADDETLLTHMGQLVGTPGYMSPEQADPEVKDIDTRTDVYSLGAILYVLLAGSRPFDKKLGEKASFDELLRRQREEDPPRPSTKVSSSRQSSDAAAKDRSTEPKRLVNLLRGDLDWITMKALDRDRVRRYGTPSEFAADIRRYLNHEAVSARPASAGYRVRKYIRRHQALVAGAATLVLVLVAGIGFSTYEAIRARQARRAALRERDIAERRFNDVHMMAREVIFNLQHQLAAIPGTTQVRKDLVGVAIKYLDALAKDATADRALQGELVAAYLQVGDIQGSPNTQNLGDLPAAMESYAKAEQLARVLVAQIPSSQAKKSLADALIAQAYAAKYAKQSAVGSNKATEALAIARERARSDPASQDAQIQLGSALQCAALAGPATGSISLLEEEASLFEGMLAHDAENPIRWRNAALAHKYAAAFWMEQDRDRAFPHLQRAEQLDRLAVRAAPNDPERKMSLAIDLSQWSEYYQGKKNIPKAIEYTRTSLAIRRELAYTDPKDTWAQDKLSYILTQLGDLQLHLSARRALSSYKEARRIAENLHAESLRAQRLATSISGMGDAYQRLGDVQHSCTAYAESVRLYREIVKFSPDYAGRAKATEKAYSHCQVQNQ